MGSDFTGCKSRGGGGGSRDFVAAVSGMVMAGAGGVSLVTDGVMTVAMACVMVRLMLLYGTQAAVTIRLRIRGQSPRKQNF